MILTRDVEFTADMIMSLILKFRDAGHVDILNAFKEGEALETIDTETLVSRLEKSFGLKLETVKKIVNQDLGRKEIIILCHLAIEIANSHNPPKRKADTTGSTSSKKAKATDGCIDLSDDKVR